MAQHVTDADFEGEVLKSSQPVVIDFYADWCGPCKMMAPIIEELAETYKGKVKIGKLNVDTNPDTPGKYGVASIPTTIFFKAGKEIDRLVGFQSKDTLKAKLDSL